MAAYAIDTDVASEFAGVTFNTTTKVKKAEVDAWLGEETAFINGEIQNKYLTPVTGDPTDERLLILKRIAVLLVSHRVARKLKVKTSQIETSQGSVVRKVKTRREEALEMLDRIKKGLLELQGATLRSSSDGVRSFTVDEGLEHEFKRDTDQW